MTVRKPSAPKFEGRTWPRVTSGIIDNIKHVIMNSLNCLWSISMHCEASDDTVWTKRILSIRTVTDRSTVSTDCFRFDREPLCASQANMGTRHHGQLQIAPNEQTHWCKPDREEARLDMSSAKSVHGGNIGEIGHLYLCVALPLLESPAVRRTLGCCGCGECVR